MPNTPLRTQSIVQVQERALELGWFHELEISFSYWHGGKRLLDGPKFQWPNETVLEDVRAEGLRLCRIYDISETSSLELVAFRVDREVPRVRSQSDDHWHYPEREQGLPPTRLRSCHLIWSSKAGDAPSLSQWQVRKASFTKYIPVAGTPAPTDLLDCFSVEMAPLDEECMRNGIAISDGKISLLSIEEEPVEAGARFARVAGHISIATAPGSCWASETQLLEAVSHPTAVIVRPTGRGPHWDTTRLHLERQAWSCRLP